MAYWTLNSLIAIMPGNLPRLDEVRIDGQVLWFTLAATVVTGLVCGLAPALRRKDVRLNEALKEGGRGAMGGRSQQRVYGVLVGAQVALALVLLIGAGLMLQSLVDMIEREQGFDPENVLALTLAYPNQYTEQSQQVYKEALKRVKSLPGVESVSLSYGYPSTPGIPGSVSATRGGEPVTTAMRVASPGYFQTLRVPLVAGRVFEESDSRNGPAVAVISQELARRLWPGGNPVGQMLHKLPSLMGQGAKELQVIGVVGDIVIRGQKDTARPDVYTSIDQTPVYGAHLMVRTSADPSGSIAAIRDVVRQTDKRLILDKMITLEDSLGETIRLPKFYTWMLSGFAVLALVTVGVYGVLSYTVSRRTQEIGIRMALGAQVKDVLKMLMGWGMRVTLAGVAAGLGGAFALTRVLASQLSGISATDPVTFVGITVLVVGIALVACYVPARRAARVDPLAALRNE